MRCPHCHIMLVSAERRGIEIDFCPCCWGVWLDRGELNAIIEREGEADLAKAAVAVGPGPRTLAAAS